MSTFKKNPKLEQEIGRSTDMIVMLKTEAEGVAQGVRSIGPVGESAAGAHYVDQIEVEAGIVNGQAVGRVNAKKWTSHFIEFGTIFRPALAPLRRAAEAAGLHVQARKG